MKRIFSRSLKTTLFGIGSIVLAILPVFLPVAAPVCLKLSAVLGGLGLVAAQDNLHPPSPPSNKFNSWLVLPLLVLAGLASVSTCSAFISQWQPTSYRVFVGTGNPNTNGFATNGATGSAFYQIDDPAAPVVWIKTGTNGYFTATVATAAFATFAQNAQNAQDAYTSTTASDANHADTAGFADTANNANNSSNAGEAARLHSLASGHVVEFAFGSSFTDRPHWSSSVGLGASAFYTTARTNIISIKPSAVAALLALVPNSVVTNSLIIGTAPP